MESVFVIAGLMLWLYMSVLFLVACVRKDNSVADIGYGLGFLVVAYTGFEFGNDLIGRTHSLIEIVLMSLVSIWGLRLSFRIFMKNKGKPEDFRYATWRKEWKWFYFRSYLQVFMLQGAIIYIIASPVLLIENLGGIDTTDLTVFTLGVCVWLVGFFFEVVGDWQLDRFIGNSVHKGKLMTSGLWKYTRHPNYFGEATMWWGVWVISLSTIPWLWYVTIASPILITILLTKISGIPMLEARMKQHPDWADYARKTSPLIPWKSRT